MRNVLFTILCFIAATAIAGDYKNYQRRLSGETEFLTTPHSDNYQIIRTPTLGLARLRPSDIETCKTRGRVADAAYQVAKNGKSLEEQVELWDKNIDQLGKDIDANERYKLREILIVTWTIARHYPDLDKSEFGDILYDICTKELAKNPKYKM